MYRCCLFIFNGRRVCVCLFVCFYFAVIPVFVYLEGGKGGV